MQLRDAAFEFRFLNQERRWNWGAIGELEPGLRRYRRYGEVEHAGEKRQTDDVFRVRVQRVVFRSHSRVASLLNDFIRLHIDS